MYNNKPFKLQLYLNVQQPENSHYGQCPLATTYNTHSGQCPLYQQSDRGIHVPGSVQKCNSQTEVYTFRAVSIVATTRQRHIYI